MSKPKPSCANPYPMEIPLLAKPPECFKLFKWKKLGNSDCLSYPMWQGRHVSMWTRGTTLRTDTPKARFCRGWSKFKLPGWLTAKTTITELEAIWNFYERWKYLEVNLLIASSIWVNSKFLSISHTIRQRDGKLAPWLLPAHPLHEELWEDTDTKLQRAGIRTFLSQ